MSAEIARGGFIVLRFQIMVVTALFLLAVIAFLSAALVSARRRYNRDTARLSARIALTSEKASCQIQKVLKGGKTMTDDIKSLNE